MAKKKDETDDLQQQLDEDAPIQDPEENLDQQVELELEGDPTPAKIEEHLRHQVQTGRLGRGRSLVRRRVREELGAYHSSRSWAEPTDDKVNEMTDRILS